MSTTIWCIVKMWRELMVCGFLTILMAEGIVSIPTPSAEDHDLSSNESQHATVNSTKQSGLELSGRKYLTRTAYKNFTTLQNARLLKTYQIAQDVLADPAISGVNTEEMIRERSILEKYVNEAKQVVEAQLPAGKTDRETNFFLIVGKDFELDQFESFVRNRNVSNTYLEISDTQKVMWQALQRHGVDAYIKDITERAKSLITNFLDETIRYVKSLTPAERQVENELVSICEMYEQHKNDVSKEDFGTRVFFSFISLKSK